MSNARTGLSTQEENVLAAVSEGVLAPDAREQAAARRAKNKVRNLSHHAFHARDVEETRHFYEDILQMPMTAFLIIPEEVITGDPLPYCHFFFEMSDGSAIAFFDYPALHEGKVSFQAPTLYDHHIALQVDSDAEIEYFRKRLKENNIDCTYVDHGAFHSIYFVDPNGLNLELCSLPAIYEEYSLRAEKISHKELAKWRAMRDSVPRTLTKPS